MTQLGRGSGAARHASTRSFVGKLYRAAQATPLAAAGLLCLAVDADAQDRLGGLHAASVGVAVEQVRFDGAGLLQGTSPAGDSIRVQRVTQRIVPLTATTRIGSRWTLDVTTLHSAGEVTVADADGSGARTLSLRGLGDVRLRATGRFLGDALVVTAGANAPTGATALDDAQLGALRVLAAPALALGAAAVGAGPSGTLGVVSAHRRGDWALAVGASHEVRGTYQPIAAFVAGAPSPDYRPGGVTRLLVGADGRVGRHRLAVAVSAERFGRDELRLPADAGAPPVATVTLGPVLGVDAQLQVAAVRVRELVLWTGARYRARHARDGITVAGSDGAYLEGGARATVPATPRTDLLLALDGRHHTGLALDAGLATSGVSSGTATVGLVQRLGRLSLQPFVRGTLGRVQARGDARDRLRAGFSGVAGGLVVLTRF